MNDKQLKAWKKKEARWLKDFNERTSKKDYGPQMYYCEVCRYESTGGQINCPGCQALDPTTRKKLEDEARARGWREFW